MNRKIKRWLLITLVSCFFLILGFRYYITIGYLAKGYSLIAALEMSEHVTQLVSSNLKHLTLYVEGFLGSPSFKKHQVPTLFFGLNVAPSKNSEHDSAYLADLKSLGVTTLRIDYGFGYGGDAFIRRVDEFIDKAVQEFHVLIHIVQHPEKASTMEKDSVRSEWKSFLEKTFSRHGKQVKEFEIGSVPNRKKWSGYTIPDFFEAVRIGKEVAEEYNVVLFSPNIQDFEPFWLIAFLDLFEKKGVHIEAATDNLFVDRAVQPESFDTHVLGKYLASFAGMDLLNKSRFLRIISDHYGVDRLISTYTQWNLAVPAPYYFASPERLATPERYADYLVRYFTLSAAGGYFDSVYWGEYISYKEGLLSDGFNPAEKQSPLPDAHHKFINDVTGPLKKRPAFSAFKNMISLLQGSTFIKRVELGDENFIFHFSRSNNDIYVLWTLNDMKYQLNLADYSNCEQIDRDGSQSESRGATISLTGSPQYLFCPN